MKQYLTFTFYILLFTLLTACGSNPNSSPDSGAVTFNIKLSRPATAYLTSYLTGNDICIDYGVATVTAIVKDSSGKTITSGSWSCSAHQGNINGIPSGNNYTVTLEGKDSDNTVTWSGEKTGISISKGTTTSAGIIAMAYVGSDTTAPTVTSVTPTMYLGLENLGVSPELVPVTTLLTATFSEKIAISSVNSITFKLTNGTTPVSGSVTYDSNTKKAIFIPATNLSYSTAYTATITTGVADMAGNNMQADKTWSFRTEAPPTSAPSTPTNVIATAGNGQTTITWNAVTGATSYNIYWSTTLGVTINPDTDIIGVTSPYIHTGRNNGTTYYYVVTAANDIYGESDTSAEVSVTPVATDTTPPTGSVIINNNATYTNSTTVTLTLSATDSNGVSQMCISNENTCTAWETYTTSKSWTLTAGDGTKSVNLWFKDGAGNVSVVTSDSIILTTAPAAPTGVTPAAGNGQATISWDAVTGATSYNIYWSTTSGVTKSTGTKNAGVTSSYSHTGRTNGTAYYYVVTAVNDNEESGESAEVTVTPQAPIHLPKTGQTTCHHSSGTVIACAGTGQDGDLQRGVAWPNPRFIDNGDGTMTDNLTGLVWTKDGNAPGPVACSPAVTKTWQAALDYVACLNTNSYLGYIDWRLPNINEIESLVHAGQPDTGTWLNSQGFNNVQSPYYWTSTSSAYYTNVAWIAYRWAGLVWSPIKSGYADYYVWPVRSGQPWVLGNSVIFIPKTGQTTCYDSTGNVIACTGTGQDGELQRGVVWPNPRFTDSRDGTVTDNLTGLVWTKDAYYPGPAICSPGNQKVWQAALDYVACLNSNSYLGYSDWRLPNINEIRSLVHAGQSDTGTWLNSQGFNNVQSFYYWSSTFSALDTNDVWVVHMLDGNVYSYGKFNDNYYVWPVRS